ncbi:MAG: hypothetical protein K6G79_06115 [Bacteroidales bacterium]|nr:hypothetical protein [Bacteroidales bacterium]
MTLFLFTALSALLLNTGVSITPVVSAAPADTLNRYVIDNQPIENFDGRQLVGEKIVTYHILTDEKDGQVIRTHQITTQKGLEPLYIIDGKAVSAADFQGLATKAIERIDVYKGNAAQAYEKYGNTGKGVIVISLKQPGTYTPSGEQPKVIILGNTSRNDEKKDDKK